MDKASSSRTDERCRRAQISHQSIKDRTVAFGKLNLDDLLKATDIPLINPSTTGLKTPIQMPISVRYLERLGTLKCQFDQIFRILCLCIFRKIM